MHVLAVGTRFFPNRHAGDKNFWLDLFSRLTDEGDTVHVVSLSAVDQPKVALSERFSIESLAAVPLHFADPVHRRRYNADSIHIPDITNYASRTATLPKLYHRLRAIITEARPDVVHFMDNMGPAIWPFIRRLHVPCALTAVTYDPRFMLYDLFLQWSVAGFAGIAVTSDVLQRRLQRIGLPRDRLHTIRWGVSPERFRPTPDRRQAKLRIGADPDRALLVWSGFTQQTTDLDLFIAHHAVLRAHQRGAQFEAEFCFKPQHFRPEYGTLEGDRVRVRNTPSGFAQVLEAADVLFAPVSRSESTLAPPLTWVEAMMKGIPVLTNPIAGVEEALGDGTAGTVCSSEDFPEVIGNLSRDDGGLRGLQEGARSWGLSRFSLQDSQNGYRDLWTRCSTGARAG